MKPEVIWIFLTDGEEIEKKNMIIFGTKQIYQSLLYNLGFADCPSECPDIWEPVCGSDGNTFGSRCELNRVSHNPIQTFAHFSFPTLFSQDVGWAQGSPGYLILYIRV